jgi:peptide/nickel transport system substrate-binding protein
MRRIPLRAVLVMALGVLAFAIAACGGSDNDKSSSGGASGAGIAKPTKGKQGGHLTVLAAADVDYLDPGQTYYTFGYMVHYAVQRTLYYFEPGDTDKPHADLATGDPEISADRKTVTVHLKKGIKFSPPVNREVQAKDIKYAIERSFTKQVPSGYAGAYFSAIVGAPKKANTGDYKPFAGLTTPDPYTLVIKLSKPVGVTIAAALVMPITTPVPQEYAQKFDKKAPSTYDSHAVFTGPYMVKNDSSGKLIGRSPGKRIDLVRNPNWDKSTDDRPAYLDSITIDEGNTDATVAARRILNGQSLVAGDFATPPPAVLKQAVTRNKSQLAYVPSGGTRWIAMNSTIKPFDDVNVRKAVWAVFDRNALRLTRGGSLVGDIAQGWIPPGIPGYDESGGVNGFGFDYTKNPSGDLALAKSYMKKAGFKTGLYTGGKLLTIATNADPGKKTAEVAQAQFAKLGFKLNFRIVPQDTLYTKFCGVPKAKVAICPNVGWFKDFVDPESMLSPTFSGDNILEQGNVNWSQLNDPAINAAMKKASLVSDPGERAKAWADVNKMIVEQAPGVPYIWDKTILTESKNVAGAANQYDTDWDLAFTSLK